MWLYKLTQTYEGYLSNNMSVYVIKYVYYSICDYLNIYEVLFLIQLLQSNGEVFCYVLFLYTHFLFFSLIILKIFFMASKIILQVQLIFMHD